MQLVVLRYNLMYPMAAANVPLMGDHWFRCFLTADITGLVIMLLDPLCDITVAQNINLKAGEVTQTQYITTFADSPGPTHECGLPQFGTVKGTAQRLSN